MNCLTCRVAISDSFGLHSKECAGHELTVLRAHDQHHSLLCGVSFVNISFPRTSYAQDTNNVWIPFKEPIGTIVLPFYKEPMCIAYPDPLRPLSSTIPLTREKNEDESCSSSSFSQVVSRPFHQKKRLRDTFLYKAL